MHFAEERIKEMISERFGSVPRFARAAGLPPQTVYSVLRNGIAGATLTTVAPIAHVLGLDLRELARGRVIACNPRGSVTLVPLVSSIAAGVPEEPIVIDEYYAIPDDVHQLYPQAFLLRVRGQSMNRVLPDGSYALVDPCATVDYQDWPYAVVVGDAEATVKRVRSLNNGLELLPDSTDSTYRPIVFDYGDDGAERVSIIGRVVWFCVPALWSFN